MPTPATASKQYKSEIRNILFGARTIVVGTASDSDFTDIQSAIDSITDSSSANPYTIFVLPGTYQAFDLSTKSGITVKGSGRATVVETASNNVILLAGVENAITDMQINYVSDTSSLAGKVFCVKFDGQTTKANLSNLAFRITSSNSSRTGLVFAWGSGANRNLVTGTDGYSLKASNIDIETDMGGFTHSLAGSTFLYNVNVFMKDFSTTGHSVTTRTAVHCEVATGRLFYMSGTIQTGYGYDAITQNDITLYGIHATSNNISNHQIELRDVQGILRVDGAATNTTAIWVKVEPTVHTLSDVRIFPGCRFQTENATIRKAIDTPYSYNTTGRVYLGGREAFFGNDITGNVFGNIIKMDSNWNLWEATKREVSAGGEWYADTSVAGFTVYLPKQVSYSTGNGQAVSSLRITNMFGGVGNLVVGQGTLSPTFDVVGVGAGQTSVTIAPGTSKTFTMMGDGNYWVE